MAWLALDSNILPVLCSGGREAKALAGLLAERKDRGDMVVVAPQVLAEAEQASESVADRLLETIENWCDGIIALDSKEVLKNDCVSQHPYADALKAAKNGLIPAGRVTEIRKTRSRNERLAFLDHQKLGYGTMRELLPGLKERLGKIDRNEIPGFSDICDEMESDSFHSFLKFLGKKRDFQPVLPKTEATREGLWRRGLAFRLVVYFLIANEYRAIKGLNKKAQGSLTDYRIIVESVHADEFLTADVDLNECMALLRAEGIIPSPEFTPWQG